MPAQSCHPLAEPGAPPLERQVRRPVSLCGFATREDGSVIEVTLTDLSYDGCAINCPASFATGEKLLLSVNRRGSLAATVRWAGPGKAGLAFECEPGGPPQPASRRHDRINIEADATMRRSGKLGFRVRLFDVSPAGCKAEFIDRPDLGEQVRLKFDGMDSLEGTICWVAGSKAGVRFARPIHDAVFALLLERLNGGPSC
jgi:hypothetical protein